MEEKKKNNAKRDSYKQLESTERQKKTVFGKKKKKRKGADSIKPSSSLLFRGERAIFGVPLALAVTRMRSHDGVPLPVIVRLCIDHLNEHGLTVEGIHRVSAPKNNLDNLESMINARQRVTLSDVHEASGVLKRFLRQLPENILTNEKREVFESIANKCPCDSELPCHCLVADMLKAELCRLPIENYVLLAYVFTHANQVLKASSNNKMGVSALGLILQAALNISQPLVRIFLLNATGESTKDGDQQTSDVQMFKDVQIKKYVPPKAPKTICEESLPDCEDELSSEELKQRSRLEELHYQIEELRELKLPTKEIEEQLWDVQTAITMLSRKLKWLRNKRAEAMSEQDASMMPFQLEMFEEKQLAATCAALREDIAKQKNEIIDLEYAIIRAQSSTTQFDNDFKLSLTEASDKVDQEADEWRQRCICEEQRRDQLLAEVVMLRNECCELRARLQLELHNTKRTLLVTRF